MVRHADMSVPRGRSGLSPGEVFGSRKLQYSSCAANPMVVQWY